ncbi:hypothetical protein [Litorivivens sp.]|uniref:hypothetical protein n=1 Tax=Litorivivens sp. TaxID=2020868 RepID=UPI00356A61CA
MNRRKFLKVLASSVALAAAVSHGYGREIDLKPELVSWNSGYDRKWDTTWLRVTYQLPDGREWHSMTERAGGDFRDDEEVMLIMWKMHEKTLMKHLA